MILHVSRIAFVVSIFLLASCTIKYTPGNVDLSPSVKVPITVGTLTCKLSQPSGSSTTVSSGQSFPVQVTVSGGVGPFKISGGSQTFSGVYTVNQSFSNSSGSDQSINDVVTVSDTLGNSTSCSLSLTVASGTDTSTGTTTSTQTSTSTSTSTSTTTNTSTNTTTSTSTGTATGGNVWSPLVCYAFISPGSVWEGDNVDIHASAYNVVGNYQIVFVQSPAEIANVGLWDNADAVVQFYSVGTFPVYVTVEDSSGQIAQCGGWVSVY